GAKEGLADDARLQPAVFIGDDVIRAQQHIHRAALCPGVGAVAADHAEFGLYRIRAEQLAANEIALTDKAGDEGGQWLVIEVEGRVPLLQAAILEHADMITDGEGL